MDPMRLRVYRNTSLLATMSDDGVMHEGDTVLLRLPTGNLRPATISQNGTINLGKFGSFKSQLLIGEPFGLRYEIVELASLRRLLPEAWNKAEDTDATNEEIKYFGSQQLSKEEIEEMRKAGFSTEEIIERQMEGNSTFSLKTDYSKDKYRKRKEAIYSKIFTPLEPTIDNISWYIYESMPQKILDMRPDTLSQLLACANIRPQGRVLVVDGVHGLLISSIIQRMQGSGSLFIINDADSPPDLHFAQYFNFKESDMSIVKHLNWAAIQPSYDPPYVPDPKEVSDLKPSKRIRQQKRRDAYTQHMADRDDFLSGNFDAVVCATDIDPTTILHSLKPQISGSASIAVYSSHINPLADCLQELRRDPEWLNPHIIEPFLRKYQVLSGRTHPEMTGLGFGGYILTCTRVFENPDALAYMTRRKRKADDE